MRRQHARLDASRMKIRQTTDDELVSAMKQAAAAARATDMLVDPLSPDEHSRRSVRRCGALDGRQHVDQWCCSRHNWRSTSANRHQCPRRIRGSSARRLIEVQVGDLRAHVGLTLA